MDKDILIIVAKIGAGLIGLGAGFVILIAFFCAMVELGKWLKRRGLEIIGAVAEWVEFYLFLTLKAPFEGVQWLLTMCWITICRFSLTVRAWAQGVRIRAEKKRDLREFYLKHRAQFKNWRHFQRWAQDQANEDTEDKQDAYEESLEILGLQQGFTKQEFKNAYRRISSLIHPDKGCPTDYFAKKVNEAVSLVKHRRNWR